MCLTWKDLTSSADRLYYTIVGWFRREPEIIPFEPDLDNASVGMQIV
jgi:hypothetical protein